MERICHLCARPTWVFWEAKPWCQDDFRAEQQRRGIEPGERRSDAAEPVSS